MRLLSRMDPKQSVAEDEMKPSKIRTEEDYGVPWGLIGLTSRLKSVRTQKTP